MKVLIRNILAALIISFTCAALMELVLFLVCRYIQWNFENVIFYAALLTFLIGGASFNRGNPRMYSRVLNMDALNIESSLERSDMKISVPSIIIILTGVFMLISRALF